MIAHPAVMPVRVAVMELEHGHITAMCAGLVAAGAIISVICAHDPVRAAAMAANFPHCRISTDPAAVLADPEIDLIATAAIPAQRAALASAAMQAGKDVISAKPACTTREQLLELRRVQAVTGRIHAVYYSERLASACTHHASLLIAQGAIGRLVSIEGFGPHRLGEGRPEWLFSRLRSGGILTDLASHQIEQFLYLTGSRHAEVIAAGVANAAHREHPDFADHGHLLLRGDRGECGYVRVDWLTPTGLSTWGDVRAFITGTTGTIELRKTVDPGSAQPTQDLLILVDHRGEQRLSMHGHVVLPFFAELVADIQARSSHAHDQARTYAAMELALTAQLMAEVAPATSAR